MSAGSSAAKEFGKSGARTPSGVGMPKETRLKVVREHDRVQLERELFGLQLRAVVTLQLREPERPSQGVQPVLLGFAKSVAHGAFAIVELSRGGYEDAASWQVVGPRPSEPTLEELHDARLPPRRREGGTDHVRDEALGRGGKHLKLQLLFRAEVGVEAALRELQLRGQVAERQAFQPHEARETQGLVQNPLARLQ